MMTTLTSNRTKNRWEDFWNDVDNSYGAPNKKILDIAQEYYQQQSSNNNLTTVDIASGNGRYAIEIAKIGYVVDAIEYADTGVERIRNNAHNQ
ncbi:MAG: hypothetical protein H6766_06270 [Candidatus Peribacteria bacterium]|nr:MAG: hypothetical protein H6766_06270 [Candidatus Peribacteria bacterium]